MAVDVNDRADGIKREANRIEYLFTVVSVNLDDARERVAELEERLESNDLRAGFALLPVKQ